MYLILEQDIRLALAIMVVFITAFILRVLYFRAFNRNKNKQWLIKAANANKYVENVTQYADGATFLLWSEKCAKLFTHEEAVKIIEKALTHDKIKMVKIDQLKEYSILV